MARRIAAAVARALTASWPPTKDGVHFHGGPHGPYVCENPRCTSPGLDPDAPAS
jgi:hypothetical protein